MFDDREHINQDLLMRAILENGQEDVPARLWDGISEGLDRAARRRKAIVWWRRASLSAVAVAASVVVGLVLHHGDGDMIIDETTGHDMIAVVEDVIIPATESEQEMTIAIQAEQIAIKKVTAYTESVETVVIEAVEKAEESAKAEKSVETVKEQETTAQDMEAQDVKNVEETKPQPQPMKTMTLDDTWPEDEPEAKKRPMTFTLSGITGSNNPQSKGDAGAIRKPTYTKAPTRTGVAESSEKSTYGIPLSVGAGVRIGLSEKWSVGTGIDYTLLSRKFYGTYIKVNEKGEIQNPTYSNIRNNQHYIGIPVNFFYNILDNSHLNFYAFAGGSVEKCVADTYALINTSIVHREDIRGVQISAAAGLGVEFLVGKHLGLYVDPRVRYYFNCRQPKSIRTEQPLMAGVEMGLRIRL